MSDSAEAILQAAIVLFSEKGFRATTTRQIAQRAEVNEVTLFRHFRSKTELFHKILEEIRRLYPPLLSEAQVAETEPEQIIEEFCRATLHRIRMAPHLIRLMLYAMLDEVDEIRGELIEKRVDTYYQSLTGAFARLRESERCIPPGEPRELARLLISQVFGLGLMTLSQHEAFDRIDEDQLARQVTGQFVLGRNPGNAQGARARAKN